jgi:glycerophosphoryl diester phosphodiesterase
MFDCTAAPTPERVNPLPTTCATDVTCTTPLVIGHRSAGGQLGVIAPENSLAAVRAAIAMGLDYVETDPRPTKDGVLVNMHDDSVERTTSGSGKVSDLSYSELTELELKSDNFAGDFACERVPTIREVLTLARGRIHVLLDANKTSDVAGLVSLIHETHTLQWAIFDTDDVAKIDEALALEPALHTMIRVADDKELADELAHFAAHPPIIVEIHDNPDPKSLIAAVHQAKHRAQIDVFPTDLAAKFNPDPALYQEVFATGIDLAQTDRPDLVLKFLDRWLLAPP